MILDSLEVSELEQGKNNNMEIFPTFYVFGKEQKNKEFYSLMAPLLCEKFPQQMVLWDVGEKMSQSFT